MPIDDVNSLLVDFMAKSFFPRANISFFTTRLPLNNNGADHAFFASCLSSCQCYNKPFVVSFAASGIYEILWLARWFCTLR